MESTESIDTIEVSALQCSVSSLFQDNSPNVKERAEYWRNYYMIYL